MQELEKILEEIESMEYPAEGIGCGLEDVSITDRYESAEYGWNEAVERITEIIRNHMNDGWIPVECKLPKTNGIYNVARHIDGHFISDSSYFDGQNTWHSDNRVNHSRTYLTDVIAWRPLPEPYRPERSDDYDGE